MTVIQLGVVGLKHCQRYSASFTYIYVFTVIGQHTQKYVLRMVEAVDIRRLKLILCIQDEMLFSLAIPWGQCAQSRALTHSHQDIG